MGKFMGYMRLMRPVNCFMMGLAVIVGAALASPTRISSAWLSIVYGCITGFALTAASIVKLVTSLPTVFVTFIPVTVGFNGVVHTTTSQALDGCLVIVTV